MRRGGRPLHSQVKCPGNDQGKSRGGGGASVEASPRGVVAGHTRQTIESPCVMID